MRAIVAVTLPDVEDPRELIRKVIPALEGVELQGKSINSGAHEVGWVYSGTLHNDGDIGCIEIQLDDKESPVHSTKFWTDLHMEEL